MRRILCSYHEKWLRQRTRFAFRGDLMFLHCLQQCALCLGCCTVYFVCKNNLGKYRPGMEFERGDLAIEYRYTKDVGWQQVAGELNTLEVQTSRPSHRMGKRCFADAWQIFY